MKRVFLYLIALLGIYSSLGFELISGKAEFLSSPLKLIILCGLIGGIGGITYCLRGIYLNACVYNQWTESWLPWYFIRPIVSVITGAISCLFLKAGLIVLEARQADSPTNLAFYSLAFIAGLNVDRFLEKVEEIAQVTWGIKKSRTASKEGNDARA